MWRVPSAMATARAVVEPRQRVERAVEGEAADHAARRGIGQRRAVAVEIRQDVQAVGERGALVRAQLRDAAEDDVMGAAAERRRRPCSATRWSSRAPVADCPPSPATGRAAQRRDTAPTRRARGAPRPRAPCGRSRCRRSSRSGGPGRSAGRCRPQHAERPGMGVDQADGDPAVGGQAELRRGGSASGPRSLADRRGAAGQARRARESASPTVRRKSACQPGRSWAR